MPITSPRARSSGSAHGTESIVVSANEEADRFALGTYTVKERDLPLYQVLLDTKGQMAIRRLSAGDVAVVMNWERSSAALRDKRCASLLPLFRDADGAVRRAQIDERAACAHYAVEPMCPISPLVRIIDVGSDPAVAGAGGEARVHVRRHSYRDAAVAGMRADASSNFAGSRSSTDELDVSARTGPSAVPARRLYCRSRSAHRAPAQTLHLDRAVRRLRTARGRPGQSSGSRRCSDIDAVEHRGPGALMTNRAPFVFLPMEGRETRIDTALAEWSMLTCKSSAAASVRPYFEPLISTVSWSQPVISTLPLKVSTDSLPFVAIG